MLQLNILDNVGDAQIGDPTSVLASIKAAQQSSKDPITGSSDLTQSSDHWMGSKALIALAATASVIQGDSTNWLRWQAAKLTIGALIGPETTKSRTATLCRYLQYCVNFGAVSPLISSVAWSFWQKLREGLHGKLVVPDACPVPNGDLLLTWDRGSLHFELEVEQDLSASFFFVDRRDRKTAWELTTSLDNLTDARIWEALENFKSGNPIQPSKGPSTNTEL